MKGGRAWILGVVLALAAIVALNLYVVVLARDRDAAVVEPDYYRKAVAFDSTRAVEQRSDALGWTADVALGRPDARGAADLVVRLADRAGTPVTGAEVRVAAIHNRAAEHVVRGALAAAAPGVYTARLPLGLDGLWELDLTATRGSDHFVARVHRDTGAGAR